MFTIQKDSIVEKTLIDGLQTLLGIDQKSNIPLGNKLLSETYARYDKMGLRQKEPLVLIEFIPFVLQKYGLGERKNSHKALDTFATVLSRVIDIILALISNDKILNKTRFDLTNLYTAVDYLDSLQYVTMLFDEDKLDPVNEVEIFNINYHDVISLAKAKNKTAFIKVCINEFYILNNINFLNDIMFSSWENDLWKQLIILENAIKEYTNKNMDIYQTLLVYKRFNEKALKYFRNFAKELRISQDDLNDIDDFILLFTNAFNKDLEKISVLFNTKKDTNVNQDYK